MKEFLAKTWVRPTMIGLTCLVIGFFGGMEYKAYQIKSALSDAFLGIFDAGADAISKTAPAKKAETAKVDNDLDTKVSLEITDKTFIEEGWQEFIKLDFQFTNKTDKAIAGVKGVVLVSDLFGDAIKKITISYDEGIEAGETKLYEGVMNYNEFIDDDVKLRNTDLSKTKYSWTVDTIIYKDGSEDSR